jgi:hypothetical protein
MSVSIKIQPLYTRGNTHRYPLYITKLWGHQSRSGRRGEVTILDPTRTRTLNPQWCSPKSDAVPTTLFLPHSISAIGIRALSANPGAKWTKWEWVAKTRLIKVGRQFIQTLEAWSILSHIYDFYNPVIHFSSPILDICYIHKFCWHHNFILTYFAINLYVEGADLFVTNSCCESWYIQNACCL